MKAEMLSAVDFTAVIVWSLCEEEKGGNSSDKMSSCQFFFWNSLTASKDLWGQLQIKGCEQSGG